MEQERSDPCARRGWGQQKAGIRPGNGGEGEMNRHHACAIGEPLCLAPARGLLYEWRPAWKNTLLYFYLLGFQDCQKRRPESNGTTFLETDV